MFGMFWDILRQYINWNAHELFSKGEEWSE